MAATLGKSSEMGNRNKRWYELENGRFLPGIEESLRSDDPRRKAFAWLLLLHVAGQERGFQTRAAAKIGCTQGQVSAWLKGDRDLSREAMKKIAKAFSVPLSTLYRPDHPYAVVLGVHEIFEPGDPDWVRWWGLMRLANPELNPSIKWLVKNTPALFPLEFEIPDA
jgi:hypothetical protein